MKKFNNTMRIIGNQLVFILVAILVSSCATSAREMSYRLDSDESIEILNFLPNNIVGFSYQYAAAYPGYSDYSLRYRNDISNLTYADIYIYSVPQEMLDYSHEDRVIFMKNSVLKSLHIVKEMGKYSEFKILNENLFDILGRLAVRVNMNLVSNNLNVYSLLFLTESDDKFIKIRMTMPDNVENRNSKSWQQFVEKVFSIILSNIEKA